MAEGTTLLLVVALSAFLAPLLAGRLGLPAAVVEIVFGIGIALSAIPIGGDTLAHTLAEIGFALLMFWAGMELDLHQIKAAGGRTLLWASLAVASIFAGSLLLTTWLGLSSYYALLGSAMSIGVAVVVIRELALFQTATGQILLLVGGLGELITMIFLTISVVRAEHGLGLGALRELGGLIFLFCCAWLLTITLRLVVWWFPHHLARIVDSHDPSEIGVRAALALVFVFMALASILHVEAILATFLAGIAFGSVFRNRQTLEGKLSAASFGFFIPVFFVNIGLNLELREALRLENLIFLAQLATISIGGRLLIRPFLRLLNLPWRQAWGTTLLLAALLTLMIAIAAEGAERGQLSTTTAAAAILYATVSGLVFPPVGRRLLSGLSGS